MDARDLYPGGCEVCKGVGFVIDEDAWLKGRYRDGLVPCPQCDHERMQKHLEAISGLSEDMRGWDFRRWRKEFGRADAFEAAQCAVKEQRGFLTFWGSWGTGKTFLLACIVNECCRQGVTAVYTTVPDLLDDLRESFDPEAEKGFSQLWDRVLKAKVLALDEIEKFRASAWAEEKFFQLVDNRYRRAAECLTVFATNAEVKRGSTIIRETRYRGYLESRLLDGRFKVVEFKNGDVRPYARWGK